MDMVQPPPAASWRTSLNDAVAGLTWRGVAIIAAISVVLAVQDSMAAIFLAPRSNAVVAIASKAFGLFLTGLLVVFAVLAALNRHPVPNARQVWAVTGAVLAASVAAAVLRLHWHGIQPWELKPDQWYNQQALSYFTWFSVRHAVIGSLFAVVWTLRARERQRIAALQQRELDAVSQRRQVEEARLQALLAQIEPHFLFNTLANVRSLYQTDPALAASMLDNLTRYLTVALPRMREAESTFAREAALAEAYLAIQQIRMGSRLSFSIDVPPDMERARLPAMMLLTLVENAIKHGLGPLPEGGQIVIRAMREEGHLTLQVADTGGGFARDLGNGAGLANVRARLASHYGTSARLRLSLNVPRGVTATITLPGVVP